MKPDYLAKAQLYLNTLCSVQPNRRTGSAGNRAATDFFADTIRPWGYEVDTTPFECLDYVKGASTLSGGGESFEVFTSPYSLGCEVAAELIAISTVEELETADCQGKILMLWGEICGEQLMPKNFVFYNPEHHQKIIALLEEREPAAILTATEKNPELVGALYPFPLVVDGDFDIPNAYCKDTIGEGLAGLQGKVFYLDIRGQRFPSQANNVVARLNREVDRKIVVTAHIDAYEDAPGALDNASGTTVLLLLAEMLSDYRGGYGIEIVAFNGEDHYSVGGQMDYLRRYGDDFNRIQLAINLDDVGYLEGKSAYSFYECSPETEQQAQGVFQGFGGLVQGEPWPNGDHMIFVQNGVASIAFTSEQMPELMRTVTHTRRDTPELVDPQKLVELAQALDRLIRAV